MPQETTRIQQRWENMLRQVVQRQNPDDRSGHRKRIRLRREVSILARSIERALPDAQSLDDGKEYISAGTSHPGGGARCIIAPTGQWDLAIQAARTRNWPYWIGGAGYSALPVAITFMSPERG